MKEKKAKKIMDDVKKTYNSIANDFDRTRNRIEPGFEGFDRFISPEETILDLGCGNGRLLIHLLGKIEKNSLKKIYFGIDNSDRMIEIASEKYPEFSFLKGDQLQIPLETGSCNLIFNIRAFHHIPSKDMRNRALLEMKRVLKDNGILIISVWNLWQNKYFGALLSAALRYIFTFGKYDYNDTIIDWGNKEKRYYHAFTFGEFKSIIRHGGFTILEEKRMGHDFLLIARK